MSKSELVNDITNKVEDDQSSKPQTECVYDKGIVDDFYDITKSFQDILDDYRAKVPKPVVLVVGTTGSGKSSLINTVFGEKVAQEGTGKPVTTHFQRYEPSTTPVIIYDSKGLEQGNTAEFIESTTEFFSNTQLDPKDRVNIVWYVINGAGSRIQPFEVEVWKSLFKNIPILFIINKGDISTDADRAMIRQNILSACPERGQDSIFDAVSGSRDPVLNVANCTECGSDDIEIRRRKCIATCAACGHTFNIDVEYSRFVKKTLDILPQVKREAFINAQAFSCSQKDERVLKIIKEFYEYLKGMKISDILYTVLTTAMVRLAVLWKFQHYGVETSHSIACGMLKKIVGLSKFKLFFLSQTDSFSLKVMHTIPILVLWNRCLRSLFISTSSAVVEGKDLNKEDLARTVETSFDCLNEEEVSAVVNFLETTKNDLDALLKREMPRDPNGKPCIPEPFIRSHSTKVKKLLAEDPVEVVPAKPSVSSSSSSSSAPSQLSQPQKDQQQSTTVSSPSQSSSPIPSSQSPSQQQQQQQQQSSSLLSSSSNSSPSLTSSNSLSSSNPSQQTQSSSSSQNSPIKNKNTEEVNGIPVNTLTISNPTNPINTSNVPFPSPSVTPSPSLSTATTTSSSTTTTATTTTTITKSQQQQQQPSNPSPLATSNNGSNTSSLTSSGYNTNEAKMKSSGECLNGNLSTLQQQQQQICQNDVNDSERCINISKDLLNLPVKVKSEKKEDKKLDGVSKKVIQDAIDEEVRLNQVDDKKLISILDKQLNTTSSDIPLSASLSSLPSTNQNQNSNSNTSTK